MKYLYNKSQLWRLYFSLHWQSLLLEDLSWVYFRQQTEIRSYRTEVHTNHKPKSQDLLLTFQMRGQDLEKLWYICGCRHINSLFLMNCRFNKCKTVKLEVSVFGQAGFHWFIWASESETEITEDEIHSSLQSSYCDPSKTLQLFPKHWSVANSGDSVCASSKYYYIIFFFWVVSLLTTSTV